jgi:DNA-damage-inducible protein J
MKDLYFYTIYIRIQSERKVILMAAKTANVLARVEPEVKEQAEDILGQLGIPASVLINMLYKQIIMTRGIPFSLSLHKEPVARDEMSEDTYNAMMAKGLAQAKSNDSRPLADVIDDTKRDIREWTK